MGESWLVIGLSRLSGPTLIHFQIEEVFRFGDLNLDVDLFPKFNSRWAGEGVAVCVIFEQTHLHFGVHLVDFKHSLT